MLIDSLDNNDGLWFNIVGSAAAIAATSKDWKTIFQSQNDKDCFKCGSRGVRSRDFSMVEKSFFGNRCLNGWENDIEDIGDDGDCGIKGKPFMCYKCRNDGTRKTDMRIKPFGGCRPDEFSIKGYKPSSCDGGRPDSLKPNSSGNWLTNATQDIRETAATSLSNAVANITEDDNSVQTEDSTPAPPRYDGSVGPTYDDSKPKKKKKKKKIKVNRSVSTPMPQEEDNTMMYGVIGLAVMAAGYIIYK